MLGTDHEPGIYVRTLNDLFRAIEETSNDMEYEVSMSYLEASLHRAHKIGWPTSLEPVAGSSWGACHGCPIQPTHIALAPLDKN